MSQGEALKMIAHSFSPAMTRADQCCQGAYADHHCPLVSERMLDALTSQKSVKINQLH